MTSPPLTTLLADIALIVLLAQLFGRIAHGLGAPAVLGEIVVGFLLGPTVLGATAFRPVPADVQPYLTALANVGIAIFMFGVGQELDHHLVMRRRGVVARIVLGSILTPVVLGAALAVYLGAQQHAPHRAAFIVFMSAAMSVTALPVLARLLIDRGLEHTPLGQLALACAAVNDGAAWGGLALAVALADSHGHSPVRFVLVIPFGLALAFGVRPLLRIAPENAARALMVPLLFGAAALTAWMGLSPASGAFVAGAIVPRELRAGGLASLSRGGVEDLSRTVLLPIFFVSAGLSVDLRQLGSDGLLDLGLILLVAVTGKVAGTLVGARGVDLGRGGSLALAGLMNARGLTELVILSVGLEVGAIDRRIYAMMVAMAVITTAMVGPLLSRLDQTPHSTLSTEEAVVTDAT